MLSKEDKKEHPIFYWALLLLMALCAFQLFSIAIGEAEADTFPIGTGTLIEDQPNVAFPGGAIAAGVRQLNGTLWHFTIEYTDATHRAILANYSNDNGDTWDGFEVMDETETEFGGTGYPSYVHDAVVISNNSIIILVDLYAYDTANKHELHLLCHWNNSDLTQWEQMTIYSHVTYPPDSDFASMCINSTDIILIAYERKSPNYIHHDKFNPTTRSITTGSHSGAASTYYWGPWALVNSTDVFIIAYPYNPGAGQRLYFKIESDWSAIVDLQLDDADTPTDVIVALDDTFVYNRAKYSGYGYTDIRYWNASGSGTRLYASTPMHNSVRVGLSNQSDRWILISNYDSTNDRMLLWSANYSASATHWQSTQTIYFVETSDIIDYTSWMPHALFPVLKDYQTQVENHTQIPLGGAFLYFVDNDVTDYDFYNWKTGIITWPGVPYWTYDPTAAGPDITNEIPVNGTTGASLQPWCHVNVSDANLDTFNITWYENSTGSWVQRQQNLTVSDGTFWWRCTQATAYSTTYYWRVDAVDDGELNTSVIFYFTTGAYIPGGGGGGGGGGSSGLQLSFSYQDTTYGIKFTPGYPRVYTPSSIKWTFGDGSSSTRESPTHWYRAPGEYIVTLEVVFTSGVRSSATRSIMVDEFSDLQYIFHMVELDGDRVWFRLGYYEIVLTEMSLAISGMLAAVAVVVSTQDRRKYGSRVKESTGSVVLRIVSLFWAVVAFLMIVWIEVGGV